MKRFKGIDLVNRGLEELQTEVHNIVQEVMIKTISKKKKCKKAKWLSEKVLQVADARRKTKGLSEEALQIAVKRREAKSKEKRKDLPI